MKEELRKEMKKELKREVNQAGAACAISVIALIISAINACIGDVSILSIVMVVCMAAILWCTALMYNALKKKVE